MVKIKQFSKKYKHTTIETKPITFDKKVTLIIGPNGSGKTTVLKGIANLINYEGEIINEGTVLYAEELIRYPEDMSVNTYLNTLLEIGKGNKILKEELLIKFDLYEKRNDPFKSLSKGMKQKVHLIQALMEERDVYLLDEPFSGLDAQSRIQLVNIIAQRDEKFICSTHQSDEFERLNPKKVYL
ncbi:MAG: ATP-binding cassette domain-containing protein [Candidatus Izemoplasmataceae bacterium]|jgi:ABC-2 type transport system ATP-binding protein|uniref:ATP-binding cassette domain-containing protein n=1 Tax=Liberiplasma polymorphum TaxID=3374570 RepID=UPI003775A503